MTLPFPSRLYREAAGLAVDRARAAAVASGPGSCAMCGVAVIPGDPVLSVGRRTYSSNFNNAPDLAVPLSKVICGDCATLWKREFLQKYSRTVANRDGVFKLASDLDCAAFILNPPEPPFVAIRSVTMQQHLIWRAPVSSSRDVFFLRVGDEVLRITRAAVLRAAASYKRLVELMRRLRVAGEPCRLDRDLASERVGSVRADVAILAQANEAGADVDVLASLAIGDWWALKFVLPFVDSNGRIVGPVPALVRVLPLS